MHVQDSGMTEIYAIHLVYFEKNKINILNINHQSYKYR